MLLLTLSLIALIIGPAVLAATSNNRRLDNFLFSFVLISVGGILLIDLLPELWSQIGLFLLPPLAIGFFGPGLVEIGFHKAADKAHKVALILGILGLLLHSAIDGIALTENQSNEMLSYAVILHRLVVGLSIWWLVEPVWGRNRSYAIFSLLIIATVLGYFLGDNLMKPEATTPLWIHYFQALVAGTLLHVIIHRPHIDDDGHHHDHAHALQHDPEHSHSHGIVIKHIGYFSFGAIVALVFLWLIHHFH